MELTRRNACLSLLLLSQARAWGQELPQLASKTYPFEELAVSKGDHAAYRDILEGRTHTGDYLEVHETVLEPGAMPHPPHRHIGEELFLISSGTVEATVAGKSARLGPGSAFFVASNEEHGLHNVGNTAAQYFVITLGRKAD